MAELLFSDINPARYGDNHLRQPLILPKILANASAFLMTDDHKRAHAIMVKWADLEATGKLQDMKETTLQGEFISEVFGQALGYVQFSQNLDHWEIREHYSLSHGQDADAAIGFFAKEDSRPPVAVIELKGPRVIVDRHKSNGRTAVRQCWDYLNELPSCPWGIVCNYVSFRLYHRNCTPQRYELFTLQELRDVKRFREFLTLFQRGGLLDPILGKKTVAERLLKETEERQKVVGKELYKEYHNNRVALVGHLQKPPYNKSLDAAIAIAQTLLDRIMFVAFCEDRDLLPTKSIEKTWRDISAFTIATNPRWHNFLNLFTSIDKGNDRFEISPFNGGLFAHNDEVDNLELDDRWTDFFVEIGGYDFRDEINVDVLGHLFEHSITDIEAMRAGTPAVELPTQKVSGKRKREGVYYTPPRITNYIVENTLGPCIRSRFAEIAKQFGVDLQIEPTKDGLENWLKCQEAMLANLRKLRVCDLACGSGAFLIKAFDYLEGIYTELVHAIATHREQNEQQMLDDARRSILRENLFGVDLSSEGVEIARLALWIRSAQKGKTLADLSGNVKCGNSIVDDREVDPKAFNWQEEFKEVFAEGGFDCIISNPPYVKLQNLKNPALAAFLAKRYRSAQTGNFDMYLPFIEHGLEILRPGGRLGFIAPNVWLFNEYGQGLRELVLEGKSLEKFVDFKSHQVFEDATTYTALQFFRKEPQEAVEVIDAPDGQPEAHTPFHVSYDGLGSSAWALLPDAVQCILDKMSKVATTLANASKQIFQGLITSDDEVYHLVNLGPGKYFSHSLNEEVELEDSLLKPLISGEDAVPFTVPPTDKYVLFPYRVNKTESRLLTPKEMKKFGHAWGYLQKHEKRLRAREGGKFDNDNWYTFGRNQSIDKQELPKIGLPQTVDRLSAFYDPNGERYFNNVRVNGVLERDDKAFSLWFLLGILNSKATDYVFRHTAKPKDRGYFEANKQFIAPLPIPNVKPKEQKPVAGIAMKLAELHGKRLEVFAKVRRRITVDMSPAALVEASPLVPALSRKLESFIEFPMEETLQEIEKFGKRKLKAAEKEDWDSYLSSKAKLLAEINKEIVVLTADLNKRVYALYGLGASEIDVIEKDYVAHDSGK